MCDRNVSRRRFMRIKKLPTRLRRVIRGTKLQPIKVFYSRGEERPSALDFLHPRCTHFGGGQGRTQKPETKQPTTAYLEEVQACS